MRPGRGRHVHEARVVADRDLRAGEQVHGVGEGGLAAEVAHARRARLGDEPLAERTFLERAEYPHRAALGGEPRGERREALGGP